MDLILNEKQYIEKMLELGDCSPKDLGANIALLTRYMYQEKYTQKEIYNGIEEFASKVDSDFDINNWYSFIDKCIGKAKKRDLLSIDYIPITQKELDTIKEIKNPARERLAFTLLVIAKFNNLKSETNNNWINYSTLLMEIIVKYLLSIMMALLIVPLISVISEVILPT